MFSKNKNILRKGFTLVELVIVIAIIAILFIAITVSVSAQVNKSKETGIENDFHSYYIGAKSAIVVGDKPALSSKTNFVKLMNEYIDDEIEVDETSDNLRLMKKNDPWNNKYEFVWKERDNATDGRHEYWLAFVSKGMDPDQNWIHEPEKQVSTQEQKYSVPAAVRTNADGTVYNYIELIGYYDTGVTIDGMTDANNDGSVEDDIAWMFNGLTNVTAPGSGSGSGSGGSGSGGSGPVVNLSDWTFYNYTGFKPWLSYSYVTDYTGPQGPTVDLVLPDSSDMGYKINGVDRSATEENISNGTLTNDSPLANTTFRSLIIQGSTQGFENEFKGMTVENVKIGDGSSLCTVYYSFSGSNIKNLYVGASDYGTEPNNRLSPRYYTLTEVTDNGEDTTKSAFTDLANPSTIENIEIHSSVPAISFKNCNVKTVTIGSNVKVIGEEAFAGNTGLTSVVIDNNIGTVNIKANAFPVGTTLTFNDGTVVFDGSEIAGAPAIQVTTDGLWEWQEAYGQAEVLRYVGPDGAGVDLVFPTTIETMSTSFDSFETSTLSNKTFNNIQIENVFLNVGSSFLYGTTANKISVVNSTLGMRALRGIITNELYVNTTGTIRDYAFQDSQINSIEYHSRNIGVDAFNNSTSTKPLTSVIIGSEVTTIYSGAFIGNDNLTEVTIQNNIDAVDIRSNAFPDGTKLKFNDGEQIYVTTP